VAADRVRVDLVRESRRATASLTAATASRVIAPHGTAIVVPRETASVSLTAVTGNRRVTVSRGKSAKVTVARRVMVTVSRGKNVTVNVLHGTAIVNRG
jgi:folate-dependent tRNA-U54 methylase TrmFO/GidA